MSKVIVIQFVTLDGVVEDPDGSGGTAHGGWAFRHPETVMGDKFLLGASLETGVKLLGRTTWELFAGIFPGRDDPFSTALNTMEKVVATRSRPDLSAWPNSTVLEGDLVAEARRRREHQDVIVAGSGSVVAQLAAADLVDQYRLMVFPVVLGKGRRLFEDLPAPAELDLVSSESAGHGVLRQTYDRA